MKIKFSRQLFEKSLNIECQENYFIRSRALPCRRTDIRTGRTE